MKLSQQTIYPQRITGFVRELRQEGRPIRLFHRYYHIIGISFRGSGYKISEMPGFERMITTLFAVALKIIVYEEPIAYQRFLA